MGTSALPALVSLRPVVFIDEQSSAEVDEQILSFEMTEKEGGLATLELKLSETGTVDDGGVPLMFERDNFVKLGALIRLAEFDGTRQVDLFKGQITALELEFPSGASPTLVVLAEDPFQQARMARRTKLHENVSLASLVNDVARVCALTPSVSGLSNNIGTHVQLNESDLAFLRRLLARYDADVKVDGNDLKAFLRTDSDGSPIVLRTPDDLERVRIIADLADQATAVTVTGWDVSQGRAFNVSSRGVSPGPGRGTKGDGFLSFAIADRSEHVAHIHAMNETEAQAIADAAFDARARRFVVADGTTQIGKPDLRLGKTVTLQGVGSRFENDYHVVLTRHHWDRERGYKTDFTAESAFYGGQP